VFRVGRGHREKCRRSRHFAGDLLELRIVLAKIVGHFQFCSLQNAEELQGVYDGFALVVVVGDHEGVAGVFLDFLDARDPGD